MKKPLLIFFVLLMLGAMFIIGENPEYNPFNEEQATATEVATTGDVIKDEIKKGDEKIGEE